jgi:hypothetical protein
MVMVTVVSASALFGSISTIVSCGVEVTARVPVGAGRGVKVVVGEAGGTGVDVNVEIGVTVIVGDAVGEGVKVNVAEGIGEAGATPGGSVGEGGGAGVAVTNAGLPNSLHPRSGATPIKPVSGMGGTASPLEAKT